MTRQQFVTLVGVVLFAIGLGGLLWPTAITPLGGNPVSCGSPLMSNTEAAAKDARERSGDLAEAAGGYVANTYAKDNANACADALGTRRTWTWPAGLIGIAMVIYAGTVMRCEEQTA